MLPAPASRAPQGPGAVFNIEGKVVVQNLAELLGSIAELLPRPAERYTLAQTEYRHLQRELTEMSRPLTESRFAEVAPEQGLSRSFSALARRAGALARHDGGRRALWGDLAALFNELKRLHLTFAAPGLMEQHSAAELAAVEMCAHGIGGQLGGSLVETMVGGVVGVSTPATIFSATAGGGRGATVLADDNRQTQYYRYGTASAGVAAGLPGAKLSLSVGTRIGGTYLQSPDFESMVKARVNREANNSLSERLLRHTADQYHSVPREAADGVGRVFRQFLLGRGYRPATGGPTFLSDDKLAKGYNMTKLHLLAEEMDRHSGSQVPVWQPLIESTYPAPADVVQHCVEIQAPLPADTPINRSVPSISAHGRGALPYREVTTPFAVSLGLTGANAVDGFAQVTLGYEASVRHNYRQFNLRESRYAHEMLDPALHGDFRETLALVQQIDDRLQDSNGAARPVPARLALYARTKQMLAAGAGDAEDVSLHAEAFGPSPPAQLRAAIAAPSEAALHTAGEVIDRIRDLAVGLIRDGATLLAKPDRFLTRQTASDLTSRRRAAFERLNENIWGGACPNDSRRVLSHPEKFVAQSHDALSLALGLAGVHVAVLKRQLAGADGHGAVAGTPSRQAIDSADARYATARELLGKGFLPLAKDRMARLDPTLESTGQWKGQASIVRSRLVGPGSLDAVGLLGAAAGVSTEGVSVSNQVAALGLTAEVSASVESRNVDASRLGRFVQIKVAVDTGAPYVGKAMTVLLKRAIEWAWPGVTTQDLDMVARDVVHQLQGFFMSMTTGNIFTLKLRRAPDTAGLNLQMARLIAATRSGGPDISGVVPLGAVNLKIGGYAADNTLEHALEVMGTDLGIHLLQFGKLKPVIEAMAQAPDDARQFRRAFDANPGLIACYFANRAVVPTLIDRFLACRNDTAWTAEPGRPHPNEFYRYYRTEPFQRLAGVISDTRCHAPGVAAQHRAGTLLQAALSPWMTESPDAAQWNAVKAHVASLSNPEQRFNFYVGTRQGREAFRMFCAILGTTSRINEAAGHQVRQEGVQAHPFGFGTKLRDAALKTGRVIPSLPDWGVPPAAAAGGSMPPGPPAIDLLPAALTDREPDLQDPAAPADPAEGEPEAREA